jgi:hypothetical protein
MKALFPSKRWDVVTHSRMPKRQLCNVRVVLETVVTHSRCRNDGCVMRVVLETVLLHTMPKRRLCNLKVVLAALCCYPQQNAETTAV